MTLLFYVGVNDSIFMTKYEADSSGLPYKVWYWEGLTVDNYKVGIDEIRAAYERGLCTDRLNNFKG